VPLAVDSQHLFADLLGEAGGVVAGEAGGGNRGADHQLDPVGAEVGGGGGQDLEGANQQTNRNNGIGSPVSPAAALDDLLGLGGELRPGRKFDLAAIRVLRAELGQPQDRFAAVHIAGTNGKGRVAALIAAAARAAGWRTGLYTSPHLTMGTMGTWSWMAMWKAPGTRVGRPLGR